MVFSCVVFSNVPGSRKSSENTAALSAFRQKDSRSTRALAYKIPRICLVPLFPQRVVPTRVLLSRSRLGCRRSARARGDPLQEEVAFAVVARERRRALELQFVLRQSGRALRAGRPARWARGDSPGGSARRSAYRRDRAPLLDQTPSRVRPRDSAPQLVRARAGRAHRKAPQCAPSQCPPGYALARDRRRSRPGARTGPRRRRSPRHARARQGLDG